MVRFPKLWQLCHAPAILILVMSDLLRIRRPNLKVISMNDIVQASKLYLPRILPMTCT